MSVRKNLLFRSLPKGILRSAIFHRIGWRNFGMLYRVNIKSIRTGATPFDRGHDVAKKSALGTWVTLAGLSGPGSGRLNVYCGAGPKKNSINS